MNTDVKILVKLFEENKERAHKIVNKMKEIIENMKPDEETKDVYKDVVNEVTIAENQYYNQTDIKDFKNFDIDEITVTNEVATTQKSTSTNEQKNDTTTSGKEKKNKPNQHFKNAQRNLQIDKDNEIIKDHYIRIAFKKDTPEEMTDIIKIALTNCKMKLVVIKTADEFENFIGNNNDTAILER